MNCFDRTNTLQQLERQDWGEPTFDSHLVVTCHRLRRKPLSEFTVEDLRILIGQKIGLPFLIPIALEQLEIGPLAEGDYYAGDLLAVVLLADDSFWTAHPEFAERIREIVRRVRESLPDMDDINQQNVRRMFSEATRSLVD